MRHRTLTSQTVHWEDRRKHTAIGGSLPFLDASAARTTQSRSQASATPRGGSPTRPTSESVPPPAGSAFLPVSLSVPRPTGSPKVVTSESLPMSASQGGSEQACVSAPPTASAPAPNALARNERRSNLVVIIMPSSSGLEWRAICGLPSLNRLIRHRLAYPRRVRRDVEPKFVRIRIGTGTVDSKLTENSCRHVRGARAIQQAGPLAATPRELARPNPSCRWNALAVAILHSHRTDLPHSLICNARRAETGRASCGESSSPAPGEARRGHGAPSAGVTHAWPSAEAAKRAYRLPGHLPLQPLVPGHVHLTRGTRVPAAPETRPSPATVLVCDCPGRVCRRRG